MTDKPPRPESIIPIGRLSIIATPFFQILETPLSIYLSLFSSFAANPSLKSSIDDLPTSSQTRFDRKKASVSN
jgi:hypothetical protein